jgi:hypothetical protein
LPGAAPNRRSLAAGGKWTWPLVLLVFRGSRRGQVELCLNVLRSSQGSPSRSREPPAAEASQAQSPAAERLQGLGSWHVRFFPTYLLYVHTVPTIRYDRQPVQLPSTYHLLANGTYLNSSLDYSRSTPCILSRPVVLLIIIDAASHHLAQQLSVLGNLLYYSSAS